MKINLHQYSAQKPMLQICDDDTYNLLQLSHHVMAAFPANAATMFPEVDAATCLNHMISLVI